MLTVRRSIRKLTENDWMFYKKPGCKAGCDQPCLYEISARSEGRNRHGRHLRRCLTHAKEWAATYKVRMPA